MKVYTHYKIYKFEYGKQLIIYKPSGVYIQQGVVIVNNGNCTNLSCKGNKNMHKSYRQFIDSLAKTYHHVTKYL